MKMIFGFAEALFLFSAARAGSVDSDAPMSNVPAAMARICVISTERIL
jgi:hypothetical protein